MLGRLLKVLKTFVLIPDISFRFFAWLHPWMRLWSGTSWTSSTSSRILGPRCIRFFRTSYQAMGTSTRGSSSLCPYPNGSLQEVSPAAHRLPMAPSVTTWPQQLSTSLRMSGHVETDECHRSRSFSSCLGQFCHMSNRRDTCLEFANNVCYPAARPTDSKPMEPIYRMCLAGKGQERTTYDIEWQQESKRCNTKTNFFLRWKNSFAHAIQPNVLQISRCKIFVAIGNKQFRPEKKEAVDRHIVVTFCHLLLLIVTCCHLLLLVVATYCYLLSHVVTCCYLLSTLVTYGHLLLLVVTSCYLLFFVCRGLLLFLSTAFPLPLESCRQRDAFEQTESCHPGAAAVLGGAICISRTGEAPTGSVFFFGGICRPWLHL